MTGPVVLWLQQAFRRRDNPALARAVQHAARHDAGLVVLHGLDPAHPLGSPRVNRFVTAAALETLRTLAERGAVAHELTAGPHAPLADQVATYARDAAAVVVVTDDPGTYLPRANAARAKPLLAEAGVPFETVEANVIVPTAAYGKAAVGAYAIRRHLQQAAAAALSAPEPRLPARFTSRDVPTPPGVPVEKADADMHTRGTAHDAAFDIDEPAGERAALAAVRRFVANGLATYGDRGDLRASAHHANLSAHLHVGAVGPRVVANAVIAARAPQERKDAFLEQIIVRRELAFNAARFLPTLRSLDVLPEWARTTLAAHDGDPRDHVYTLAEFERAATHDALWNATQNELRARGTIHSYARMYWGKKIIEWSATHAEARRIMEDLNGAWAFDGRGATMWASHLWCFGLHDRAFQERPVFGKLRWMSAAGTARKFDVPAYVAWTDAGCPTLAR